MEAKDTVMKDEEIIAKILDEEDYGLQNNNWVLTREQVIEIWKKGYSTGCDFASINMPDIIKETEALCQAHIEALKAVLASIVCNDDMSISYAIDGLTRCEIDNALSKAEGK